MVKPDTLIGWHGKAFKWFWRCQARSGRTPLQGEIREWIVRMAKGNPTWGQRRVAAELYLETTIADVKVRAHTFAFITPAMTDKYKIPNSCTMCHADKTTAWATEALRHWPERSPWRLD